MTPTRGDDVLKGGDENDTITGLGGNDKIYGMGGNDDLRGQNGNDHVDGGTGDDYVLGNGGNDTLIGGAGKDVIKGGPGSDIMTGDGPSCGPGGFFGSFFGALFGPKGEADTFLWNVEGLSDGTKDWDVVTDFQKGVDTIKLEDGIYVVGTVDTMKGTVLTLSGSDHDQILLQNVHCFDVASIA